MIGKLLISFKKVNYSLHTHVHAHVYAPGLQFFDVCLCLGRVFTVLPDLLFILK